MSCKQPYEPSTYLNPDGSPKYYLWQYNYNTGESQFQPFDPNNFAVYHGWDFHGILVETGDMTPERMMHVIPARRYD